METPTQQPKTDRELLEEINENSRKAKNYMKWQFIITIALVVIPLLATLIMIPYALRSITSVYSSYGIDGLSGGDSQQGVGATVQDAINKYTK